MVNALTAVDSWLYHLGGINAAEAAAIGASSAKMVITEAADYSNGERFYTAADLNTMRGGNDKLVISYLSIGEAEDYRYYWQPGWNTKPPSFLDTENPEWKGNFEVKYWDPEWQKIILGYVDKIVNAGFNGVYLDIIDGYEHWEQKAPNSGINYRQEMANLVAKIRAQAESTLAKTDPGRHFAIIGQNGEELLLNQTYLKAVDGVASEDIRFYYENGNEKGFKKVSEEDYQYRLDLLKQAEAAGKQAFVVEYMTSARQTQYATDMQKEMADLKKEGIPVYIAQNRELTNVAPQPGTPTPPNNIDIYGTNSHDKITDTTGNDRIWGLDGNDTIIAGAGNDSISGDAGHDSILGGAGIDTILGGLGDDTIEGGLGADKIDGGNGIDTVTYANSNIGVTVNLAISTQTSAGDASGDVLANFENLIGSAYNDKITGNSSNNALWGGAGNDVINAGNGNDVIYGESGSDNLYGDAGNDFLAGGNGADALQGGAGDDTIEGEAGADTMDGGYNTDTITYANSNAGVTVNLAISTQISAGDASGDVLTSFENVIGSAYNDSITGHNGNNMLFGGLGSDIIRASKGNDALYGEVGNDQLYGDAGIDTLIGGAGADRLTGGSEKDIFQFLARTDSTDAARDVITDFTHLVDKIGLVGLGFTGISAGTGNGTVLGYTYSGGHTIIHAANSNFSIDLVGIIALNNSDFIF